MAQAIPPRETVTPAVTGTAQQISHAILLTDLLIDVREVMAGPHAAYSKILTYPKSGRHVGLSH